MRVLDLVVLLALVLTAALVFAMFRTGRRDRREELEAVRRRLRARARDAGDAPGGDPRDETGAERGGAGQGPDAP